MSSLPKNIIRKCHSFVTLMICFLLLFDEEIATFEVIEFTLTDEVVYED